MKTTKCRSCGAAVVWALTKNEKRMPLDAEPSVSGTFRIVGGMNVEARAFAVAPGADMFGEARYTSHFCSCPNADKHRKPREKK